MRYGFDDHCRRERPGGFDLDAELLTSRRVDVLVVLRTGFLRHVESPHLGELGFVGPPFQNEGVAIVEARLVEDGAVKDGALHHARDVFKRHALNREPALMHAPGWLDGLVS
jgi:hypothetical protein